ncbi:hypothetical protein AAID97_01375 [Campylobacter coli]
MSITKYENIFDKNKTDYKARDEFLTFMKENFPKTKLIKVFNTASVGVFTISLFGEHCC